MNPKVHVDNGEDDVESAKRNAQEGATMENACTTKHQAPNAEHRRRRIFVIVVAVVLVLTAAGLAVGLGVSLSDEDESDDNETSSYIVDYSCKEDDDCAEKNIGNCCGYYPACVNVKFTPDPKQSCPEGGVGICGFPVIDGCMCNSEGRCEGYQKRF